jgi:hypothetical protein
LLSEYLQQAGGAIESFEVEGQLPDVSRWPLEGGQHLLLKEVVGAPQLGNEFEMQLGILDGGHCAAFSVSPA